MLSNHELKYKLSLNVYILYIKMVHNLRIKRNIDNSNA